MQTLGMGLGLRHQASIRRFRPSDQAGLTLWLDRGTRVLHSVSPDIQPTDGETIRRWVNRQNPGTYDADQTTGSLQPIYNAGVHREASFDGVNDLLVSGVTLNTSSFFILLKGSLIDLGGFRRLLSWVPSASADP